MKRQETFELTEWGQSSNGLIALVGIRRDAKSQFSIKELTLKKIAMPRLVSLMKHGLKP